jgi:phosphotriesterase-related protein
MSISPHAGKVQTVLGLIDPQDLGMTLTHEHLLVDQSVYFVEPASPRESALAHQPVSLENLTWVRYNPKDNLDNQKLLDEDLAIEEATLFKQHGGSTIVDMTNIGLGRDPVALARISRATGLNIIMGSGYYIGTPELETQSEEEMAEKIMRDVTAGVDDTGIRSGIIGELGCSHPLKAGERKLLRAGALAQQRTGVAINVHPGRNENDPLEIIDVLAEAGADLSRVVISHMDRCGYLLETKRKLLGAGCYIEYDVFGWEGYYPAKTALADGHLPDMPNDVGRIKEIKELIDLGYQNQILLSHDIGHKMQLVKYGGWGYAHLLREVVPLMTIYGIEEGQIDTLTRENPKRLLTVV